MTKRSFLIGSPMSLWKGTIIARAKKKIAMLVVLAPVDHKKITWDMNNKEARKAYKLPIYYRAII